MKRILFVALTILGVFSTQSEAKLTITTIANTPYGEKVTLSNSFIKASFYPEWGGRMCELIDLKSGVNTVFWDYPPDHPNWGQGWGGALDDRAGFHIPYELKILKQSPEECQIVLTHDSKIRGIKKIISLKENCPSLTVTYHFSNFSQEPTKNYEVGIRNFFRPSGKAIPNDWEVERAVVPTIKTIRVLGRDARMAPEINSKFYTEVIPTWNAFVNQRSKLGIGFAFHDDSYRWMMRWIQGETSTYEFIFSPIPAGKKAVTTFSISMIHGMDRYVDISPYYAVNMQLSGDAGNISVNSQFYALDHDLKNISIQSDLRDPSGNKVAVLPNFVVGSVNVGELRKTTTNWKLPATSNLIVHQSVFDGARKIGDYEFPVDINNPPKDYTRSKHGRGQVVVKDIPGWNKEEDLRIVPTSADTERGYMVYQDEFASEEQMRGKSSNRLKLNFGENEFESFSFDLFALKNLKEVSISTQNPNVEVRLEEIVPIPEAIKLGKPMVKCHTLTTTRSFDLSKGKTKSIWMTWDGRGVKPGKYPLEITISSKNAPAYDLLVDLHIYDVRLPDRNIFDFQLGGGYIFSFLAKICGNDLEKSNVYFKDLGSHRCNVANIFNGIERKGLPIIPDDQLRDRITGQQIQFTEINDETVLDLSWYDPWIQDLIDNGLVRIHSRQSGLKPRTEHQKGIMREVARYMAEKGYPYRDRYVKFVDELPPDFFPAMAETGDMYHKLGWRVLHTTSPMESAPQMKILNPSTDFWHGVIPDRDTVAARLKDGGLDEKDEIWSYAGWGAVWKTYVSRRLMAWDFAAHDIDGMHLHVYHRGKPMENIIELSPEGPISSPAWEGARDGLEDVQYYKLAWRVVDNLTKNKVRVPALAEARATLSEIRATMTGPSAADLTVAEMRLARKQCLDILLKLKQFQPKLTQSVEYGFTPLMESNHSLFKLFGKHSAVNLFSSEMKIKTGQVITSSEAIPNSVKALNGNSILLLDTQSPICLELMERGLIPMTKAYPAENSYAIWEIPNPDVKEKWIILIVGGNSEGLLQGTHNFLRFLRVTPGRY